MSDINDRYIIASQKECDEFYKIIDIRIMKFREIIERDNNKIEKKYYDNIDIALLVLKNSLINKFQKFYDDNFSGKRIPREVILDKTHNMRQLLNGFLLNKKCNICGETRVLNVAHIIPRSNKGPNAFWNYIILCANHHFLFDQAQLTQEEWNAIDWNLFDERAKEYALSIRLESHKKSWSKR